MKARTRAVASSVAAGLLLLALLVLLVPRWRERVESRIKRLAPHPTHRLERIDEPTARRLFPAAAFEGAFRYDPVAVLLPREDREETWSWPEHPAGKMTLRTNNLGFRADRPTRAEKESRRILVLGDSHTQGLVENQETFASRLEVSWSAADAPCEVLDAGVAYTGPHCYGKRLEKFLYLDPDVVVAVVYVGNDFLDDLAVRYALDGWSMPGSEAYYAPVREAAAQWPGPTNQGLNQVYRFASFPGEAARATSLVAESCETMAATCAERGITFLVVLLPTKADVDRDDLEAIDAARRRLGLEEADVHANAELGRRLLEELRERGIRSLDPAPEMRAAGRALYWRQDHHLNVEGHALLARLLEDELRRLPSASASR